MGQWLAETFSNPWVLIVLLTFTPGLELRASIPYGIAIAKLPAAAVFGLAVGTNILLGPIVFFFLDLLIHLLLKIKFIDRIWQRMIEKTQKKIHPKVEKYGIWGLGLFIGVPLPGSGVYSGAIGGYLLGFTRREFYLATVMGVLIAAAVVTTLVVAGISGHGLLVKPPPAP